MMKKRLPAARAAAVTLIFLLVLCLSAAALAEGWTCKSCGQTGNTGKFCPACGAQKPDDSWTCPVCGRKLTTNFCDRDGTGRTDGGSAGSVSADSAVMNITAGDHITFGHYPQTASGTDNTPIEWRVLEVRDGMALVISEYGLDGKTYNTEAGNMTWEKCSLRAWLNSEFLSRAFSAAEQSAILTATVKNDRSQGYWNTDGGRDTQDRIFLLSYAEAHRYLDAVYFDYEQYWNENDEECNNPHSIAYATDYAAAQGAWVEYDNDPTWWWLRSPGEKSSDGARIDSGGNLDDFEVEDPEGAVRPAMWLDLSAVQ